MRKFQHNSGLIKDKGRLRIRVAVKFKAGYWIHKLQ